MQYCMKVAVCDIFHCRTGFIVPAGLIEGGLGVNLGSASCHPLLLAFETPTGSHSIGEEAINHLSDYGVKSPYKQ